MSISCLEPIFPPTYAEVHGSTKVMPKLKKTGGASAPCASNSAIFDFLRNLHRFLAHSACLVIMENGEPSKTGYIFTSLGK